jgi:hypothetical protein
VGGSSTRVGSGSSGSGAGDTGDTSCGSGAGDTGDTSVGSGAGDTGDTSVGSAGGPTPGRISTGVPKAGWVVLEGSGRGRNSGGLSHPGQVVLSAGHMTAQ